MSFIAQTTTVHVWVIVLMRAAIVLSIVQNIMKIVGKHHAKKLKRGSR